MNDKQIMLNKHLAKINLKPEDVLINNNILIAVENAMEDYKNLQPSNSIPIHREKILEILEFALSNSSHYHLKIEGYLRKNDLITDDEDVSAFLKKADNKSLEKLIEMI